MHENDLILKLKQDSHEIIIYGAGMVGSLVFYRLLAENIPKERIVFTVSSKNQGNMSYLGQTVYSINEVLVHFNNVHIIVAVLPNAHKEIINTLYAHKIFDFDIVDNILLDEMEKSYVNKHYAEHPIANTTKDILFLASDNNSTSGAFLCMIDLNRELNKRKISTLVVLPTYGSGEELLRENNIEYTYILSKNWLIESACTTLPDLSENDTAVNEICRLIRQYNVKLIHNNTTYTYVGAIAAQKENKPVVWHLREYIKEQGFKFIDEKKSIQLINDSSAIVVVSDYIRSSYRNLHNSIVHKIYDGIDIAAYYYKDHELMHEKKVKILMPGMIIPLKGQMQLLNAAAILKKHGYCDFEIVFVGNSDPNYAQQLKDFIKESSLEDYITFYGRSNKMLEWYSWADITIICSKAEAFGRVSVEAQLAGCLVIGSDKGANLEIIEDAKTGFIYQYGDSNDLALKIIRAINNKDMSRKIARAGQINARESFSQERNVSEIIKMYKHILETQKIEGFLAP